MAGLLNCNKVRFDYSCLFEAFSGMCLYLAGMCLP